MYANVVFPDREEVHECTKVSYSPDNGDGACVQIFRGLETVEVLQSFKKREGEDPQFIYVYLMNDEGKTIGKHII